MTPTPADTGDNQEIEPVASHPKLPAHKPRHKNYHESVLRPVFEKDISVWYKEQSPEQRTKFHNLFSKLSKFVKKQKGEDAPLSLYDANFQMVQMYGGSLIQESQISAIAHWLHQAQDAERDLFRDIFAALNVHVHQRRPDTQYATTFQKYPVNPRDKNSSKPPYIVAQEVAWKQELEASESNSKSTKDAQELAARRARMESIRSQIQNEMAMRGQQPQHNAHKSTTFENNGTVIVTATETASKMSSKSKVPYATFQGRNSAPEQTTMRSEFTEKKRPDAEMQELATGANSASSFKTTASFGRPIPFFALSEHLDAKEQEELLSRSTLSDGGPLRHLSTASSRSLTLDEVPTTYSQSFRASALSNSTFKADRALRDRHVRTPFATYHKGHMKTTLQTEYESRFSGSGY